MRIQTERFGVLDVPDEAVIRFPQGIPGFPQEKAFVLLPCAEADAFAFLQSIMTPPLAFLLVTPFAFFPDYNAPIHIEQVRHIGIDENNLGEIWTIVTVPDNYHDMTTNLLAPLVINRKKGEAAQVVLEKTNYTTKHRLYPASASTEANGKGGG
ncbi:conserved hypothetical protein [Heliomicrobium modesticaldum Ice1]|uniref:Flagellar assembly factor FliW n=1 Tax=Heliobacterium modesticaldum (strain ATCC 51547 / Ice1) TaxID=498761 RepID=FLIW_HELMI|nr:flagellar assembly protein FliW [Heliomicrobium modesticaldum]B0TH41.1 RecName: Full=Flagellar assembly factor FliW [Heliomicrobium modesticaldum Ice1]ABZ83366.1 conserved hypothetical protein [Heliomicrobium modesticaldum Ice1]